MSKFPYYDDPDFDYKQYWQGRQYEHFSEKIAIEKLLKRAKKKGLKRDRAIEIGAGYGRLLKIYRRFFKEVVLLEPSGRLLLVAKKEFKNDAGVSFIQLRAEEMAFEPASFDAVLLVRVIHHLVQPELVIKKISRLLKPGGFLILEFANKTNLRTVLRTILKLKKRSVDLSPIDRRHQKNNQSIPFFNYHPLWIKRQLRQNNLKIITKLSVSNLRLVWLKKTFPLDLLLKAENQLQRPLAKINFGPSLFVLAQKRAQT
ncbi:MAG: class I SAM-dependent methyltransferase [Patescibacteria group bacterium]